MAKIYPQQWRQIHPFATPMITDQYYAKLANHVAEILKASFVKEAFETTEDLTDTAIRITAWFEDFLFTMWNRIILMSPMLKTSVCYYGMRWRRCILIGS